MELQKEIGTSIEIEMGQDQGLINPNEGDPLNEMIPENPNTGGPQKGEDQNIMNPQNKLQNTLIWLLDQSHW